MASRAAAPAVPSRQRGRPRVHIETWSKVSVVLFDRQLRRLDRLKRRLGTKPHGLNRAEIIRAVLDAALDCCPGDVRVSSEAELRQVLTRRFTRP